MVEYGYVHVAGLRTLLLDLLHQGNDHGLAVEHAAQVLEFVLVLQNFLQDDAEPLIENLRLRVELQGSDSAVEEEQPQLPDVVCLFEIEILILNGQLNLVSRALIP